MKLVASLIVKDEANRYLEPCVQHLLEFCDEVRAYDDGSTDGSDELMDSLGVKVARDPESTFFQHEGNARNRSLQWTLEGQPSHVLAIDADEFVSDGAAVRRACEGAGAVWSLEMLEVWRAFDECLCVREDGGWRSHPVPVLWQVPDRPSSLWRIADRALACGRVPVPVDRLAHAAVTTDASLLHFGWANQAERVARHHRYAVADGGRFHRSTHLDSILWPDDQVGMRPVDWPPGLNVYLDRILDSTMRGAPVG